MSACFLGLSALGNDENVTRIIARSPNRHRRVDGDRGPRTPLDECAIATTKAGRMTLASRRPCLITAVLSSTWLIAPLLDPQLHPWTVVRLGVLRLRTPSRDAPAHHRRPLGSAARRHLRAVLRPPAHRVAGAAPRPRRRSGRRSRLDPPSRTRRRADVVRRHGAGRIDSPGRATAGRPIRPRPPLLSRFAARFPMISVAGRATRVLDAGDGPRSPVPPASRRSCGIVRLSRHACRPPIASSPSKLPPTSVLAPGTSTPNALMSSTLAPRMS